MVNISLAEAVVTLSGASYFTLSTRKMYIIKHISTFIWFCFGEKKVLCNVCCHCNKEDSSIFGADSCDMIFFAHEIWLPSVRHAVSLNVSSPPAWARSRCGLSAGRLAEPRWSQISLNPTEPQLDPAGLGRADGDEAEVFLCKLRWSSTLPALFHQFGSLFNSYLDIVWKCPFWINKSWFLKCVVLM